MPSERSSFSLIAAPYTAFRPDGSLHLERIADQAASLHANGVAGAFICGTTGEGLSLTVAERMQAAEQWKATAAPDFRVLVHVGHLCLADARALAAHAQSIGAHGIGCLAPSFFKPASLDELVAWCVEIASAAAEIPFFYYHIPAMTGVNFRAADFLGAADGLIPNLAGVKFTGEDLMDFAECVQWRDGAGEMVFGRDEMLLAGLALGARGAIGSTYNYLAPVFHRLVEAFQAGDLVEARQRQAAANRIIQTVLRFGPLPAGKAAMKAIGLDCGPLRLPLRMLSAEREAELHRALAAIGFAQEASARG